MKKAIFSLLFLNIFLAYGQEVAVDLSNPNATVYTHLHFLQAESYDPGKASSVIYNYHGKEGIDKAIKLKKILDGKGLIVDFSTIPSQENYTDSVSGTSNSFVLFPDRMPQISLSKYGDQWYYSNATVNQIDQLYDETFSWNISWLQKILPISVSNTTFLGIQIWQYLGLLFILILAIILSIFFRKIIFSILKKVKKKIIKTYNQETELNLKKLSRPFGFLVVIFLIEKVLPSLQIAINTNAQFFWALAIMKIIFWTYAFLKIVKVIMNLYTEYAKSTSTQLDEQLIPILNIILSGVVVMFGLFRIMPMLGMDMKAIILGASIGGLAVALASQDTVKNLLGTVMIFLDKPFQIGDWIVAGSVEGTVEEVGFRSSKIRTIDTSIIKIPNSQLSEIAINNKGLRKQRRYNTTLGIRYDTPPDLIEGFVAGIRGLIMAHPDISHENYKVALTGFGDSSLNIMVNVYFTEMNWNNVQDSKHTFHIAIIRLAKALKVDFAFPSSTLYVEQFPDKNSFGIDYDTDPTRIKNLTNDIVTEFKNSHQNKNIDL